MKNKRNGKLIKILLLVMAMAMLFTVPVHANASASSTYKQAVTYYQNGKYKKARQQFKTLKANANESCVKSMSGKMKAAYLKKVQMYPEYYGINSIDYLWGYYLTDIDKDGKAELLIKHGTIEADCTVVVYKYIGGKAKKIGSFSGFHTSFFYDPRGNGMTVRVTSMNQEMIYTVKIKNGKLKFTYWLGKNTIRELSSSSSTMYLPYALDGHVSNHKYDYSPLK